MKCCGKGAGGAGGDNIAVDMKEVKVEAFDNLFKDAADVLQQAEDFRAGLQDSKATCMAVSGAFTLKTGGMSDALSCFVWSAAHTCGIDKVSPKLNLTEEPHFQVEIDPSMSDEHKEFIEAFQVWAEAVVHSADTIKAITEKLQEVTGKANELKGTAKEECTNAGLGVMDQAKAVSSIGSNIAALAKGSTKMAGLAGPAAEALTDLKDIASKLAETLTNAPNNAKEGGEKGAKTMPEFCEKQHTGEKLAAGESKNAKSVVVYNKRKSDGKKFSSGGKKSEAAAAPAAEEAPAEEVKVEDVVPEVAEVMDA